jgi:hypothetical protein
MKKHEKLTGEIHTSTDFKSGFCVTMTDTNPLEQNPVFMHSDCSDKWEVLQTGALRNIAKGKCMGREKSNGIGVVPVDCDSEDVEKWSAVATLSSNVAFGKPAFQSFDLHEENIASIAVDGDTNDKKDTNGRYTHTSFGENPYWYVDLGGKFDIGAIGVFHRRDGCCLEELEDFILTISKKDDPENMWTTKYSGIPDELTVINVPTGTLGDKVQISLDRPGYVSLTEVEVYANAAGNSSR